MSTAFSQNVVWECRATGLDTNGGGFHTGASGTDFSQQATPQYSLSSLTSSGAGDVVLSAAAAAVMVGNVAQVASGTNFNAGFYEIISVSVGVSITFSTRSTDGASICSGVGASGVMKIGGCLQTEAMVGAASAPGNPAHFKFGIGEITSATPNVSGGVPIFIGGTGPGFEYGNPGNTRWIGYHTTRGDNPPEGLRPVFKLANSLTASEIWCIMGSSGDGIREKGFECSYIDFDCGTGNTNAGCIHPWTNGTFFTQGEVQHATGLKGAILLWDGLEEFTDLHIHDCSTSGFLNGGHGAGVTTVIARCKIHDITGAGNAGIYVYPGVIADPTDCLIYNVTGSGSITAGMVSDNSVGLKNTTIFNCRKGIYLVGRGSQTPNIENVIFDSIIDKALYSEGASNITSGAHVTNCAFRNNGTNIDTDWAHATTTGTVTPLVDPFTSSAGNDFTLNNAATGGALLRGKGTSGANIGWDQTVYPAAGGSGLTLALAQQLDLV